MPVEHSPSRTSPTGFNARSPTRTRRASNIPPGFLAPPKPKKRPVEELSVRELRDLYDKNAKILASPAPSTSSFVERVLVEQRAVESRLVDLVGVEAIRRGLEDATIGERSSHGPSPPQLISAKQRALAKYAPKPNNVHGSASMGHNMSFQEAIQIEQEAHAADLRRQHEAMERKRRMGLPIKGELLSREEREARIWAFMNHKPTESDMEDDDDDDDEGNEDDDPSSWFEDDQDDGRKGQNIIEPDYDEELTNLIRVDASRMPGIFYEPQGGGGD